MSDSLLVAAVTDDVTVSFDPAVPRDVGVPSGVVMVSPNDVKGGTSLPVPFILLGDGVASAESVLKAIQESLVQNKFQLQATAVRLHQ